MPKLSISDLGFHVRGDALAGLLEVPVYTQDTGFTYNFENFFHPFVGELIEKLNREGLEGMLDPGYHEDLNDQYGAFFDQVYETLANSQAFCDEFPTSARLVRLNLPTKAIELEYGQPYSGYNWELLFHIPLAVAAHLSKNQRFAEAQRWFHHIFDPTSNDTTVPVPERYWKFLAFRNGNDHTRIDRLLTLLSKPNPDEKEARLRESVLRGYDVIRNHPFQPHAVARTRLVAYQYSVVMKYLDNLIAWGDSLFREDTVESLNEATQRYVLAANLLGERPERIPPRGSSRPKTFAELRKGPADALGNALVELEGQFPLNLALPLPHESDPHATAAGTPLFGIGRTLYFAVPHNEKLLGYWDTVADRLFKIRTCLNIEGVFRQLPLFEPPLDPGMLVKAAAAGIDIRTTVSGLNQPRGPMRCQFLIQKALELASEVRGMGGALLSAAEKADGERLALLRQGHEIKIQQLAQDVRLLQWKQAREATESLLHSRTGVRKRFGFYQRVLGEPPDQNAPEALALDRRELTEENFDEAYAALVGQYAKTVSDRKLPAILRAPEQVANLIALTLQTGSLHLNMNEFMDLNVLGPAALILRAASAATETATAAIALLPDAYVDMQFMGVGAHAQVVGGSKTAAAGQAAAGGLSQLATISEFAASYASKAASYQRRADEWILQRNLAAHELTQIGRQIIGSLIAEQVAHHEYTSLQQQVEQSQEVDRFLREKFTNAELYSWMQGELMRLYYEYYRFAVDTARKAETAMKVELMRPEVDGTSFVKFNYWDGGRKGLLSGEALYLDVKRIEMAYHDNNRRELELTKHVSLLQVDPLALISLRETGFCTFRLPEELFDMDGPGHYMRRIKDLALTVPCVAGPFTSINCTLTLQKSSIRTMPSADDYARAPGEDTRFSDYFGSVQSIVTSSAQHDSGLFETSMRDERFLPFENAGAISEWQLRLPANPSKDEPAQFNYDTISDVVLHIRYTARDGGEELRKNAVGNLATLTDDARAAGSVRLFSVRHEFPDQWAKFRSQTPGADQLAALTLNLRDEHYPFWSRGLTKSLQRVDILARSNKDPVPATLAVFDRAADQPSAQKDTLTPNSTLGHLLTTTLTNIPQPAPVGQFTLFFEDNSLDELWLAIAWGKAGSA
jgi:hypothetical protein